MFDKLMDTRLFNDTGVYGMGLGALAGMDVGSTMAALGDSAIGPLAKFAVAFPLSYHYIGGIRHIVS
jgi:succinate dehydrogenase/fumarate reductase cytochrome b subunit